MGGWEEEEEEEEEGEQCVPAVVASFRVYRRRGDDICDGVQVRTPQRAGISERGGVGGGV